MKTINKDLLKKAESVARKMSKLNIGTYESNLKRILRDLVSSKLEQQQNKANEQLNDILGGN